MIINQWLPAAHKGDAIGDSARRMRDLWRSLGHQSEIYALTIDDELKDDVLSFGDTGSTKGDVTMFHFALPSPMTDAFGRLPRGRVLQYHNVTPASFLHHDPALLPGIARTPGAASLVGRVDLRARCIGLQPPGPTKPALARRACCSLSTRRVTRRSSRPALEHALTTSSSTPACGRTRRTRRRGSHRWPSTTRTSMFYRFDFVGRIRRAALLFDHSRSCRSFACSTNDSSSPVLSRRPGGLLPERLAHPPANTRARRFWAMAADAGPGLRRRGCPDPGRRRYIRSERSETRLNSSDRSPRR